MPGSRRRPPPLPPGRPRDVVVQVAPPLICGQAEFDEMEQILRHTLVDAADVAFPAWRDTSPAKRTRILFTFRQLLDERAGELAAIITAEHGKRVQALGGAKNHMVVLPDADLDRAADQAVDAGFGSAGERCMAIPALVAVGDIADELVARIKDRAVALRTGDGTRCCDMGPLVTSAAQERALSTLSDRRRDRCTTSTFRIDRCRRRSLQRWRPSNRAGPGARAPSTPMRPSNAPCASSGSRATRGRAWQP